MVCAPVRSIIPSLKLGDYLSVQAHKPCFISHLVSNYNLYGVLRQRIGNDFLIQRGNILSKPKVGHDYFLLHII